MGGGAHTGVRRAIRVGLTVAGLLWSGVGAWADEIHRAAAAGDVAAIERLLARDPSLLFARDEKGETPLHHAVAQRRLEATKLVLDRGAEVDAQREHGFAALHDAVWGSRRDLAELLLARNADPNLPSEQGHTALHNCGRENVDGEMVDVIVKGGGKLDRLTEWGERPIRVAARFGNVGALERFLAAGEKVDAAGPDRMTPLLAAAFYGQVTAWKLLLDKGANVRARDKRGWDALHRACEGGNVEIVTDLLDRKFDVNGLGPTKGLPLHDAAWAGHAAVAKLLIDRGSRRRSTWRPSAATRPSSRCCSPRVPKSTPPRPTRTPRCTSRPTRATSRSWNFCWRRAPT